VKTNLQLGKKKTAFRSWTEKEVYGLFPALEYLLERDSENLSGGEMQMVAIGRALLGGPGLVLLDEPSQGLAPKLVQDVMGTIARLKNEGISVLVVEQNVRSVLAVCDRAFVIRHGKVVYNGPARALLDDERLLGELS
jgi:branched-chain amino acid transport system ATP-binding protein